LPSQHKEMRTLLGEKALENCKYNPSIITRIVVSS
jgi:hypothetical protein